MSTAYRALTRVLLAAVALACVAQLGLGLHMLGPDFDHYAQYAQALLRADLRLQGHTRSPTGAIVCHHSIGPGLTWMPGVWARGWAADAGRKPAGLGAYAYGCHIVQAGLLALLVHHVLRRAGFGAFQRVVAMGLAYLGTPLFYYSAISLSSELLACLTAFGLWAYIYLRSSDEGAWRFYLYVGLLAGAAVCARANNVLLAAPVAAWVGVRAVRSRPLRRGLGRCALLASASVAAAGPALATNWLSTGSPLRSPHGCRLPSGSYVWFDWADLHVRGVLFSHWHGLLTYSPVLLLALVGVGAWIYRDATAKRRGERPQPALVRGLMYALALGFLGELLLFSAFRCWWVGTGTFGGRQFLQAAPFAALALAYLMRRTNATSLWSPAPLIGLVLALWTCGLYWREFGASNFTRSYGQVASAQWHVLKAVATRPLFAVGVAVALVFSAAARRDARVQTACAAGLFGLLVCTLGVHYSWRAELHVPMLDRVIIGLVSTGVFLCVVAWLRLTSRSGRVRACTCAAAAVVLAGYVAAAAWRTRAAARRETPAHEHVATFEAKDWLQSYDEYKLIAGYQREKAAYRQLIVEFRASQPRTHGRPAQGE